MSAAHDPVEAANAQAQDQGWPARCDPSLAFENPELAWFVEVWREHLHGRVMPARSDLTARVLKNHLNRVMLFERIEFDDGHRYRVRLMATALANVWGEISGRFIDDVVPPRLLPRWYAFIDAVLIAGRPLRFAARVAYQEKDHLVAELAGVPLSDDMGNPTMVMAAIHASSEKSWDALIAKYDGVQPKQRRMFPNG